MMGWSHGPVGHVLSHDLAMEQEPIGGERHDRYILGAAPHRDEAQRLVAADYHYLGDYAPWRMVRAQPRESIWRFAVGQSDESTAGAGACAAYCTAAIRTTKAVLRVYASSSVVVGTRSRWLGQQVWRYARGPAREEPSPFHRGPCNLLTPCPRPTRSSAMCDLGSGSGYDLDFLSCARQPHHAAEHFPGVAQQLGFKRRHGDRRAAPTQPNPPTPRRG
jgi:hypothetical protein